MSATSHPEHSAATGTVLTFLGGNGTVTGSKTLLTHPGGQVLVDCGMYQGQGELRRRNWEPLPVDAAGIDTVLLTHAHLDHTGYFPALVRQGFRGKAHATPSTAALARIVLLDSAHLQEEDARYAAERGYSKHARPAPLYTTADVERALQQLHPLDFGQRLELGEGGAAEFSWAGHVLGSATVRLDVPEADTSVLFTGDLGRPAHPILRPPAPPPATRFVVVESTYGDRRHPENDLPELAAAVRRTVARGGSVVIPAFAVDRTEVVLHALATLVRRGEIPQVPVYVDSPMALRALAVYRTAISQGDPDVRADAALHDIDAGTVQELTTPEQSMSINDPPVPSIIVSASGMATGGRVLHHLKHLLPDARNTVVLVGFQAVGTRARDLAEGAREVKIHGRYVPVRAEVVDLAGFSVHADADELLQWLGTLPAPPDACFVVHGEPSSATALARRIERELQWLAVVPRFGERIRVD